VTCPCCENEIDADWPETCPHCGARFEFDGDVTDDGRWRANTMIVQHGKECVHELPEV